MKISQIDITEYNPFKNLTLDLTYPKGHPKEGKPLDKVCFLGQSGTGKTSLLNLIRATLTANLTTEHDQVLQGTLNQNISRADKTLIVITAFFKDVKSIIEIREGGKFLWEWKTSLPTPKQFIETFYLGNFEGPLFKPN